MVEDHVDAHGLEDAVEALGRGALEEGVGLALGAHAVDDFAPIVQICVDHGVHGIDVVLPVAVDADGHIVGATGLHQPGEEGVLMPAVTG